MSQPITNIPIPAILEINNGAVYQLEKILRKHYFSNVVILFDAFTFDNFEHSIKDSLSSIKVNTIGMEPNLDIKDLISLAFSLERHDVVIAVGGGTVIDYGKYIAFSRRIPFISVPTSPSNDGFASSNCSLIVNQKKTTVPAKVPYGIIADLDIIKQAPDRFILAGIGDLMSNITALYDWEFEEENGVSNVNHFALMLSKKAVNSFIRTPMDDIKNPIFLKELVSSLTMGGIATVISGNSAPISGSEHLISHALDKIAANPAMHGIQVGIATYLIAKVQEHRVERMNKVFSRTGFFNYIKEIPLNKDEYEQAIKLGPSIKPNRFTYLHDETYQNKAIELLHKDPQLQQVFSN
ncbi:iron-containing alcohol dehydrogenase family protein [Aquibacillus koreensis]|uniref:Iron-containing alcohol dehydrogenase family protein n=1 Tax=Aquibacillus koreensis TaxID=279446 RepID=A0A9X3WHI0_9BACI|nr:iron-containing alcohol dehydrogenase family protein [Aquibacillus koreensis]MCT2535688.1 iron-containing alcohol dehydrogenase family protein [Aquibacillus koreensis]MDC3420027.1 iron-containing alcohol dehydrogenase family protein [Aquibacillus koreensis]